MANTYLVRNTPSETFNKLTVSCWFKGDADGTQRNFWGLYDNSDSNRFFGLYYSSNGSLYGYWKQDGSTVFTMGTTQKFRDPSAWYHFVMTMDTTLATASDRVKFYVNGERITSFEDSLDTITQSKNVDLMNGTTDGRMQLGGGKIGGTQYYWNGSMSHCHMCVGYAYDASSFGETDSTSGIWKPKTAPSVTYGTNGFFLKFENSGAMGTDSSGNSNTFTTSGTLTQNVDTPSNNFATNNVLSPVASGLTIANGNLSITSNSGNGWRELFGIFGASSGKFYWEQKVDNFASGLNPHYIGICDVELVKQASNATAFEDSSISRAYAYTKTGQKLSAGTSSSYGNSWTTGDIVGIAVDLDNGKIYFSKNGTWQNSGNPTSGATGTGSAFNVTTGYTYVPSTATYYADNRYSYNFGQGYFGITAVASAGTAPSEGGIFEYDCPSGYQALCTKGINSF